MLSGAQDAIDTSVLLDQDHWPSKFLLTPDKVPRKGEGNNSAKHETSPVHRSARVRHVRLGFTDNFTYAGVGFGAAGKKRN